MRSLSISGQLGYYDWAKLNWKKINKLTNILLYLEIDKLIDLYSYW